LAGVERALAKRNMSLVAFGSYIRNTTAVKTALLDIMKARPQAVVTVGAYKPVATFVKVARQLKFDPVFVAISFVGSDALAHELGSDGNGVVISQVIPFPRDPNIPVVAAYQAALKVSAPDSKPGFISLEGYVVGRLAVETLKRVSGEPTREAFLDAVTKGEFDFGGVKLHYMADKNQGADQVFLTVIQPDGSLKPVTRLLKTSER
jgi:ABC-type branched-subunit amino acid transport system substrate-binding protein